MTLLLRRRPREVYRVYSEEEYLNGAGSGLAGIGDEWSLADEWPLVDSPRDESPRDAFPLGESPLADEWPLGGSSLVDPPLGEWPLGDSPIGEVPPVDSLLPVEPGRQGVGGEDRLRRRFVGERRLRRIAGVAMLAGAVGAVGGVVILNLARTHVGAGARGNLVAAATRSSRVARSSALDQTQSQVTASSRPAVVARSVEATTARSRVLQLERSLGRPGRRRSNALPAHHLPVRRRADVAVVADDVPRPSSGEVAAVPAAVSAVPTAQVSTTAAPAAPAPPRPAPENRAEFGFER
jgi:hypothetical protein